MKPVFAIASILVLTSGCYTRPGGSPAPSSIGFGQAAMPIAGATAGAVIGQSVNGSKGAAIGAAAGAAAGIITTNVAGKYYETQIAEARDAGAREARTQIMNDYWESHAVNGGNGPKSTAAGQKSGKTIVYPAGVYDGIYYGPREIQVP